MRKLENKPPFALDAEGGFHHFVLHA